MVESACSAGDPGSIPGSGRSPGEGTGYSPQYSWAFLGAQTVKNLPAMWETWVRSLDWEDPLEAWQPAPVLLSFPGGSNDKKSACIVKDLGSIPGLGRSPGGGHGNHSSILAWSVPMDRGIWRAIGHGVAKSRTLLS